MGKSRDMGVLLGEGIRVSHVTWVCCWGGDTSKSHDMGVLLGRGYGQVT